MLFKNRIARTSTGTARLCLPLTAIRWKPKLWNSQFRRSELTLLITLLAIIQQTAKHPANCEIHSFGLPSRQDLLSCRDGSIRDSGSSREALPGFWAGRQVLIAKGVVMTRLPCCKWFGVTSWWRWRWLTGETARWRLIGLESHIQDR